MLILAIFTFFNIKITAAEQSFNTITPSTPVIYLQGWEMVKDIDPNSPIPDYSDFSWIKVNSSLNENLYSEGNWIIKTSIIIKDSLSEKTVFGMFPSGFITAYQIYWDKIIIANNGQIGINKANEKPGLRRFNFVLPHKLMNPGKHEIVLRLSNHRNISPWKWFYGTVAIGQYDFVLNKGLSNDYITLFILGVLFVAFFLNLFLFISRKGIIEHLLFSFVCLLIIFDYSVSIAPKIFSFTNTYIHFEYYFYQFNSLLFVTLFPTFLIYYFSLPKKTTVIILALNLLVYFLFTDIFNIFDILSLTVLILSTALTIWALILRREGSIIITIGLFISWAAFYFNFAFAGLSTTMAICTSFSIARQFAKKETAEKEAQLKSARLENELLKKNINPHFVLNTLTSIIVWLRKDSASAIKLIESLAEEFRMINQISSLKLIPITQEIDLCRAHLKIMSFRKGADYKLETLDIDENDDIPPMIFHTLIENGLTHGYENKSSGLFVLQRIKNQNSVKYILTNDGEFNFEDSETSTGFGAKYIKGRLEESFPGKWNFTSNKLDSGWQSTIEIKKKL